MISPIRCIKIDYSKEYIKFDRRKKRYYNSFKRLMWHRWKKNIFSKEVHMNFTDVNIRVPVGMTMYLKPRDVKAELQRNALLLYPYIKDKTISHGKAAEILGISKYELIELYDKMGLAYLSIDIAEAEEEVENWERMKEMQRV